jgi:hypothetical protein
MLHRSAGFDYALALHQNFAGPQDATVLDIEQAGRVQHDGVNRRGRILAESGGEEHE